MILFINKTYKAILLVDVLLGLCLVITLYYIGDLSFKNYYSAKLDQRKVQVDMFDKALEGYANNHLAIKNITYDEEGKQNVIYQKTYPSSLDELEKMGILSFYQMKIWIILNIHQRKKLPMEIPKILFLMN